MESLELSYNQLKVDNIAPLKTFYANCLGMKVIREIETEKGKLCDIGYAQSKSEDDAISVPKSLARLQLFESGKVKLRGRNVGSGLMDTTVYWKIGINVENLDLVVQQLRAKGISLTAPVMIPDVGYLCHLADPEGFHIELMQMTFSTPTPPAEPCPGPLGQRVTFGVITIRTNDIHKSLGFYKDILGMKLLCYQNQKPYGFDVYYLAFTLEDPPNPDPDAVENREWTYQRPYTMLEILVYYQQKVQPCQEVQETDTGFLGLGITCTDLPTVKNFLESRNITTFINPQETLDAFLNDKTSFIVKDPDGIHVRFSTKHT